MTIYYLLQHLVLACGLAAAARRAPSAFHVNVAARMLLAASLTPQVIGALMMSMAALGVNARAAFEVAPLLLGLLLLAVGLRQDLGRPGRWQLPRLSVVALLVTVAGAVLLARVAMVMWNNAHAANILSHDFNVYLNGARAFAANPAWSSIPGFFAVPGAAVAAHPHSFIFEAYLSHALMLQPAAQLFPPTDLLARLAQQATLGYLLMALGGLSAALRAGRMSVAIIALVLCIPSLSYISRELSRDAFRMAPLVGLAVLSSTVLLNGRVALARRGVLAGVYAAAAILSHTLGILIVGLTLLANAALFVGWRRPGWRRLLRWGIPLGLVTLTALIPYVCNYLQTGKVLGYGLNYLVYKGTWLEPILGGRWQDPHSGFHTLRTLFRRYDFCYASLLALMAALLWLRSGRGYRGHALYAGLVVSFGVPLLVTAFGAFDYVGINLRDALLANVRYPLSYFILYAPLLMAGVYGLLAHVRPARSRTASIVIAALTMVFTAAALKQLRSDEWQSHQASRDDYQQLELLQRSVACLAPDENWLTDDDLWNLYFPKRQPAFLFSHAMRPLLAADTQAEIRQQLTDNRIAAVAFLIYAVKVWQDSTLREVLQADGWRVLRLGEGSWRPKEIWLRADRYAQCFPSEEH